MAEKTEKSFLKGRTWYWREGHIRGPMLADSLEKRELCLPVSDPMEAAAVRQELSAHHISTKQKRVRHPFATFPVGQLIVYADQMKGEELSANEQHNMERLHRYIKVCGGKVMEQQKPFFNLLRFFTKEK